VEVHLLGVYTIEAGGKEIDTGLRTKARELLAYLLLNAKGASPGACVDAVWPDADLARGMEGFRTAVGNLRKVLRDATGDPRALVVLRVGERYRLDTELFNCDVWRFEAALGEVVTAKGDEELGAALESAAGEYRGDLLAESYYGWCEDAREDLRRRAVDALARLAQLRADAGKCDRALATLERAVEIDRYGEELYRRIMRLQGDLGRGDAVRRTFRLLERRLSELGVDAEEETRRLAHDAWSSRRRPTRGGAWSVQSTE
jgi:DNA-binding SARP family transcriptional activator